MKNLLFLITAAACFNLVSAQTPQFTKDINAEGTLSIVDQLGTEVYTEAFVHNGDTLKLKIDVSTFAAGVYMVLLRDKEGAYSKRVVIQR